MSDSRQPPDLFAGPSEMHGRMRAHDWASSPVGPVAGWPQSLRSLVKTLLASRYPMILAWGPARTQFYNDAYAALIGDKHPAALGIDLAVTLAEGWDTLGPMIAEVIATGVANWTPALLLVLERAGYREEAYFSVSHAPAEDESGAIVGMLAVCSEVTQQVLGERRTRLLRDLALRAGEARDVAATCADLAAVIAEHPLDVPFALLYLHEGGRLVLRAAVGLAAGGPASPHTVDPSGGAPWPLAQALAGAAVAVDQVPGAAALPAGPWGEPVRAALALPVAGVGQSTSGVLVVGVSPNRALDEGYRSFYDLLAGQVSAAVRNARAYAEERARAEALARLDRAKTEFFSNVSHEFRTPLTLLLGPLEEVLATTDLPGAAREQLLVAERNARRLLRLVNTLLEFARIEANRAEAHYAPTDLAALTADLASVFRAAVERAGLALLVDCPPLPEPVYVDRAMWETIVLNLLSNALKFTERGQIAVSLRLAGDRVELSVADTGCGIPEAELAQIFARFHRVAGVEGRSHEGSGIGLALVQELARLHGGEVAVTSSYGHGSRFTVAIPRGRAHLPADRVVEGYAGGSARADTFVEEALRWLPAPEEAAAPAAGPRPRILLADDNADMRAYVQRLLAERYAVEAVADGQQALEAARANPPDLVLSDVMMPRLDGVALLAALRDDPRTRTVPVILLSARAGEESRAQGLETGADDYLTKPFSARELLARVGAHIELTRMRELAAAEAARRSAAEATVRERDQFLSLVSHELKTPLTALLGYAQLVQRRAQRAGVVEPSSLPLLEHVVGHAQRLSALVESLLDINGMHEGQLQLDRQPLDLVALARRVVDALQPTLTQHTLELHAPDAPLPVEGDAARLEQALGQLLSNAVKFSPLGGAVLVEVARRGRSALVAVRDQGIGIPAEDHAHLFGRFYRAANSSPSHIAGMGVGLYIVREIVARHGGTVAVESAEGQGSTFTIALPLAGAAMAPPQPLDAEAGGGDRM